MIGELGEAVRAHGMRYGLYYSGGPDWTFDHLPIRRMVDVGVEHPVEPPSTSGTSTRTGAS